MDQLPHQVDPGINLTPVTRSTGTVANSAFDTVLYQRT